MQQIIADFGKLGGIPVRILGYGLMMVLGFACGIVLSQRLARRGGENPEVITHCGILALIGGIIGARVGYIIQHWEKKFAPAENRFAEIMNITSGGLIYYGGLLAGIAVVLAYLWLKRHPVRRYLDFLAPSLMVGLAFGRAGCLLNGCCYASVCRQDWPLGMRFPMFSKPLLKFSSFPGPFSESTDGPSPVYSVQFAEGRVTVDERLLWQGRDGSRRIRLPRELHGRLDQDQLEVLFAAPEVVREKFEALAGVDKRLAEAEWLRGLRQTGGLLRGSEHWDEAIAYDGDRDGLLGLGETRQYLHDRKQLLVRRFGSAEEVEQAGAARGISPQSGAWKPGSPQWDRADAYLREDLFALAGTHWSRKVKPAQAIGIVNALLIAGLLLAFHRARRREGQVFALMLVLYPITRFVLEAIRSDNEHNLLAGVLTHNQYTSLAMLAAGVAMFLGLHKLRPSAGPLWGARHAQATAARGKKKSRKS